MQFLSPAGSLATLISFSVLMLTSGPISAQETETQPESVSVLGKGELKIPDAFKRTKPASRIIQHEFKVGDGDKTARLTMMGAGGGVEANIKRWKGQFSGGDEAEQKSEKMELGEWEVHVVDANGAYAERVGGGPFFGGKSVLRENYAMAGAIMVSPDGGTYFAKMIGPAEVVKSNRKAFIEMVKSIGD